MKYIFYDWCGLNKQIFLAINLLNYMQSKDIIFSIAYFLDYKFFLYHILVIFLISIYEIYNHKNDYKSFDQSICKYGKIFSILSISMSINYIIINLIKSLLHFQRPFCDMKDINIHYYFIENIECYTSLPSGHTGFITILITGLWINLNMISKIIGIFLILIVGMSRILSAAHYPSDIFWGIVIAITITKLVEKLFVENIIYKVRNNHYYTIFSKKIFNFMQ